MNELWWPLVEFGGRSTAATGSTIRRLSWAKASTSAPADERLFALRAFTAAGGGSDNGEISVTGRSANVNGVFVETYLNSTTPSDRPFYVVVFC